jgi:hypothetical protein
MYDAEFILKLFEPRLATLRMSQADLGKLAFGKEDNSAIQALRRGSTPSIDRVAAMAEVLGLECYLGPPRAMPVGFSESDNETDLSRVDAARGDYFAVPWHRPGLGSVLSPIAFQRQWMADHALIPDRLRAITPDELIFPGIAGKNIHAVIDTISDRRTGHDLWCYMEKGRTFIARLTFDRGNILVSGDGAFLPPRLILAADVPVVTLLGRVVWLGFVA